MITNSNASKEPSSVAFVEVKKYMGVGSVNILAINPDNATLRKFGWTIPEEAEEPKYVTTNKSGEKSTRIRFLVQIQDLEEKPIIPMDFWIRPAVMLNKESTKCRLIDGYCRTAWGTKEEVQAHKVPEYANGPARLSPDYKPCHYGEEEIVTFLRRYLVVPPPEIYNKAKGEYVSNPDSGKLTIDNWEKLCNGDVRELKEMVALRPENKLKVIFGIKTSDDNKEYQTFLMNKYIGNGMRPNLATGEFDSASKAIAEFLEDKENPPYKFDARPVFEYKQEASVVKNNAAEDDLPFFGSAAAADDGDPF